MPEISGAAAVRFDAWAGRKLSSRELLGPETVAFIEQFYAQGNRVLAAETGLALAEYGYPGMVAPDRDVAGAPADPPPLDGPRTAVADHAA